jgi:hypothetical protein
MQNFSWIEPYRQIAEKLVDWEDRQKELIAFVEKLREKGFKVPNFNDRGVLLNEIDPFTFLMVFNRVIRDEERIKILDEMKSFFKLDFQTPSDFTGIPTQNNQNAWFISTLKKRAATDVPRLWRLFKLALKSKPLEDPEFKQALDDAFKVRKIKFNLTNALFWIRPDEFIGLNEPVRKHFKLDIPNKKPNADLYLDTIKKFKAMGRPLPELSYEAWKEVKTVPIEQQYWVASVDVASFYTALSKEIKASQPWKKQRIFSWGKNNNTYSNLVDEVQEGDFIAVLGFTNTHTQANCYCTGKVIRKDSGGILEIEIWNPELRGGIDLGEAHETGQLFLLEDTDIINTIFGKNFPEKAPKYWAGGHVWSGKPQKDRFIAGKIWEHGFKATDDVKAAKDTFEGFEQIKPNDYFAIKGLGGSNDLVIYSVGRVKEVQGGDNRISYEPLEIPLYKGKAPQMERGSWFGTLTDVNGITAVEAIFGDKAMKAVSIEQPAVNDDEDLPLNLILYGPPGTGKTYRLQNEYFPKFTVDGKQNFVMVTFHQSYGYEEFIEGMRPEIVNGQMTYKIVDGAFKEISARAQNDPQNQYAIFIDEINRGNISKIFGELLTLIEPDKRQQGIDTAKISVTLPYSKQPFAVPSNLHIIGTMNTADRSIALLDTALRRRFNFEELMPDYSIPEINRAVDGIHLGELLKTINRRVEFLYDREHVIGHSYFTGVENLAGLLEAFRHKVIPLLQEYFFEDWDKTCRVLNCHIEDSENKFPMVKSDEIAVGENVQKHGDRKFSYQINPDFKKNNNNLVQFFKGVLD